MKTHNRTVQKWLIATTICLVSSVASIEVVAQETTTDSDAVKFDTAIQLESFDMVWDTIKKTHWDKDLVGESWDAAKAKYRPMVESADNINDVRGAISEMLNTLEQSHFGIIPADSYDEYNEETKRDDESSDESNESGGAEGDEENSDGTAGMEIRLVEGKLVVTRVFEDSAAANAGVEPGWIIKLIGKRTSDQLMKAAEVVGEATVVRKETAVGLVCDNRTSGNVGSKLAFAFIDNDNQVRLEYLELTEAPGESKSFFNLPPFMVNFEAKELGDFGYISFNSFLGGPQMARDYQKALADFRESNKKGLIIDLRGNRGGAVVLVNSMCGWLTSSKQAIGKMAMTGGNEVNLGLNPRKPRWKRPVAVLTDECSISAAEIMAGGIKDLKLGRIFGGTTAGLSLPSTVAKLPNGDGFQFAVSAYYSASGESIEGVGVTPDEPVTLTREMLSSSSDPVLSAAKKWILEQEKEKGKE